MRRFPYRNRIASVIGLRDALTMTIWFEDLASRSQLTHLSYAAQAPDDQSSQEGKEITRRSAYYRGLAGGDSPTWNA
jgi:hypothetical protein